jgi:gluconokinase
MVLLLMGVTASGKTTVGHLLRDQLGWPFYDGDDFHPPANIEKMKAGHPLDDADRAPWLDAIGRWLGEHCGAGGVMSCSALKRRYRDQLRGHCTGTEFLHLSGTPEVIGARQASRPGHFMPASLLASQFDTLEPLAADEGGVVIDVGQSIDAIVDTYISLTGGESR